MTRAHAFRATPVRSGVCNEPSAIYACGCDPVPTVIGNCEGNVVDAVGTCGGTCESDTDGDGVRHR